MSTDEDPDLASLFAPVAVTDTIEGVLTEARGILDRLDDPVDAELWGSDVIGALAASAEDQSSVMDVLAGALVPAAEAASTAAALAALRVFAVVGSPALRDAAAAAAGRVAAQGVSDPAWASALGSPQLRECWHFTDTGGRQESLTLTFAYGDWEHAVSVLIDHGHSGKIKDVWVAKSADLLADTKKTAGTDQRVVFEMISPADARDRLERAINAGECPEQPDQAEDVAAHRALLRARLDLLAGRR